MYLPEAAKATISYWLDDDDEAKYKFQNKKT